MFRNVVVILFAALLLQAPALAKAGDGIPNIEVGLKKKPGGNRVASSRTNSKGEFTFSGVSAGKYTLTFTLSKTQVPLIHPNAKTYFESRSNTTSVQNAYLFTFPGLAFETTISNTAVTPGTGTVKPTDLGSIVEINFEVTGDGTQSISGVIRESGGTTPGIPARTPEPQTN